MRSRRVTTLLAALIVTVGFWPGAASASNDESFTKQWALPQIGAPDAWAKTTGAGVRIAITWERSNRPRQSRALLVSFAGHDSCDRPAECPAFHAVVTVTVAHNERAKVCVSEP